MGFIRDTWQDIRGNFKYDIIKYIFFAGVAALIATAYHWIQHVRQVPPGDTLSYILVAILIFIALALCAGLSMLGAATARRDRPKITLGLGNLVWQYRADHDLTVFFLLASVLNRGEPSVVLNWTCKYKVGGSSEDMERFDLIGIYVLTVQDQKLSLTNENLLNLKTLETPVQRGQFIGGRLCIAVPGDRTAQINSLQHQIEVECQDYLGNVSTAIYRPSSKPPETLLGHYKEKREFISDEPGSNSQPESTP